MECEYFEILDNARKSNALDSFGKCLFVWWNDVYDVDMPHNNRCHLVLENTKKRYEMRSLVSSCVCVCGVRPSLSQKLSQLKS